jgi:hypothetical protein
MNRRLLAGVACSLFLITGALVAQELLQSGPPVGAANNRRGFYPNWVAGPCAGQNLCPV